jgi:hypothetical protein
VLALRNAARGVENHELVQFVDKVKKLYVKSTGEQEPSLKVLLKWVKGYVQLPKQKENELAESKSVLGKLSVTKSTCWKMGNTK